MLGERHGVIGHPRVQHLVCPCLCGGGGYIASDELHVLDAHAAAGPGRLGRLAGGVEEGLAGDDPVHGAGEGPPELGVADPQQLDLDEVLWGLVYGPPGRGRTG